MKKFNKITIFILLIFNLLICSCLVNNDIIEDISKLEFGINYPWVKFPTEGYHGLDLSYNNNHPTHTKLWKHFDNGFNEIAQTKIKWVRHFIFGSGEYYFGIKNRHLNTIFFQNLKLLLKKANKYKFNLIFVLWNHKSLYKDFRGKKNQFFDKNLLSKNKLNSLINYDLPRFLYFLKKHNDFKKTKIALELFNEPEYLIFEFIYFAKDRKLVSMEKMGNFIYQQAKVIRKYNKLYNIPIKITTGMINPLKPWIRINPLVNSAFSLWIKFLRDKVKLDFFQLHIYGKKGNVGDLTTSNDTVDIFAKTKNKYLFKSSSFYKLIVSKGHEAYIGEYPINIKGIGYSLADLIKHTKNIKIKGIFFWSYCVNNTKHGVSYGDFSNLDNGLR